MINLERCVMINLERGVILNLERGVIHKAACLFHTGIPFRIWCCVYSTYHVFCTRYLPLAGVLRPCVGGADAVGRDARAVRRNGRVGEAKGVTERSNGTLGRHRSVEIM